MRPAPMTPPYDELETALRDLGAALTAPEPAVDLARAARLRLEEEHERPGSPDRGWRVGPWRPARSLVLALAGLLLLAGLATAIGLGLPGLRIVFLGQTATPFPTVRPGTSTDPVVALRLGREVDLAGLDAAAGFHVRVAALAGLGTPRGAVLGLSSGVTEASLVYPASPSYPVAEGRPAAIVITELHGELDRAFLEKFIPAGTIVEPVAVGGLAGYWISGAPHQLAFVDANGNVVLDSVRLLGDVLAWSDGQVTYRIEGVTDVADAQAIAASMR